MKQTTFFKRNWLRNIVKGMSLTAMTFVFQACYGAPQNFGYDIYVEGVVFNLSNNKPIKGIKVTPQGELQYATTDEDGKFMMYLSPQETYIFTLEDVDGEENGSFLNKKDSVSYDNQDQKEIKVQFYMKEKE